MLANVNMGDVIDEAIWESKDDLPLIRLKMKINSNVSATSKRMNIDACEAVT